MSPEAVLFAPVMNWRRECREIVQWIENNRHPGRLLYAVDRPRPTGALYLYEFAEAYWDFGQKSFWRIQPPNAQPFEFDGWIFPVSDKLTYPAYGEKGCEYYRSIEDANLVPNTYTSYFIFRTGTEAINALTFVANNFHP